MILSLRGVTPIRHLWTCWTWHPAVALQPRHLKAEAQYGIKGNFFVKHFSFIMNSAIFIFILLVFLTTNFISSESQRIFRYLLLGKPLVHLRNVCLEFSGCCVLINRHFHHVNEALCSWGMSLAQRDDAVYWWALGWEFESWLGHYKQAGHAILSLPLIYMNSTWNSSGNQHSGSLVSKNWSAKTQYGIKGNFFINHFSFISNCHIYISSVSVLDYKCLISPLNFKDFSVICFEESP